jgi:hypothetical protein
MTFNQAYIYGALVATGLLMTWFLSDFPIQLFKLLHATGWRKNVDFWPPNSQMEIWLRHDWETWVALELPEWPAKLITCSYCLSWWISGAVALGFLVAHQPWLFAVLAIPGWAFLSNLGLRLLK